MKARIASLVMAALSVALAAGTPARDVRACGHCIEDKIAAVYDHAVSESARRAGHRVVYLEWRRIGAGAGPELARLRSDVATTPGVLARTVRVSAAPAAVSFAFDPARHDETALIQAVNRRLIARHVVVARLEKRAAGVSRVAPRATR
jgi:hypothetical protein